MKPSDPQEAGAKWLTHFLSRLNSQMESQEGGQNVCTQFPPYLYQLPEGLVIKTGLER